MPEIKKTHSLRVDPGMSIRMLADYMTASEQAKRTLLTRAKYVPIAPTIQHDAARESITTHLSSGAGATDDIKQRIEILKSGLQGSQFEIDKAENNADYLERYLETLPPIPAKAHEVLIGNRMPPLHVEGFAIRCAPDLVFKRVNQRNVAKMGMGFLRYSKGKALPPETACWQGAIAVGYLTTKLQQGLAEIDPDRDLTAVIDVWAGQCYTAPSNSVYRFKEVKAACAGIAQRWKQIPPPPNAVF
ncbi:hypothetical protein SAMN05192583_0523 [Sphingomonas gellani]|uniref:Uncharacterized protein n=1 Tax=Sphingomonas gellani TaxID=1166340 RepID=A0A1H7Z3L8_9SPHN|nr:hypothetical protein [Sphingomonas gellani]SEM52855.1 hypothetical protein SAMN05192583_0523 [Sphingomonas gellani]